MRSSHEGMAIVASISESMIIGHHEDNMWTFLGKQYCREKQPNTCQQIKPGPVH